MGLFFEIWLEDHEFAFAGEDTLGGKFFADYGEIFSVLDFEGIEGTFCLDRVRG